MMKKLLIALMSTALIGCSSNPAARDEKTITAADFEKDVAFENIHYNIYIPNSYDGKEPYALFLSLPGYDGLYFQGVGESLKEPFVTEAATYNEKMIIVSAQLNGWDEQSAKDVINLTYHLFDLYNIDRSRVYLEGYSGGGETGSMVVSMEPQLYTAYLEVSSKWDGTGTKVQSEQLPVYLAIAENDTYYGSQPMKDEYARMKEEYEKQGLSQSKIDSLLVLNVKENDYFEQAGYDDPHAGGIAFAYDPEVMNWLFSKRKEEDMNEVNGISKLEKIPDSYRKECSQKGTLEKIEYSTWDSLTYEKRQTSLKKTAWVYVPYGYDQTKPYNIFYLSHGGWSDESTVLGTPSSPSELKNAIDHAVANKEMIPMLIVSPTYNNLSSKDSWDYSLALKLTGNFHNELVNDLMPAVEGKYHTYAETVDRKGFKNSRNHRGFGGFSMGSVNTWNTFISTMDCFRYFMPMSGNYTNDAGWLEQMVRNQGFGKDDFFIFSASGTDDFAYRALKEQIDRMIALKPAFFIDAKKSKEGNVLFLAEKGMRHDENAATMYTWNGLKCFWKNNKEEIQ